MQAKARTRNVPPNPDRAALLRRAQMHTRSAIRISRDSRLPGDCGSQQPSTQYNVCNCHGSAQVQAVYVNGRQALPRHNGKRDCCMKLNDPCPCHSGRPYSRCCRPLHEGALPPTPEALMRSRYSAYALGKSAYIVRTTHPDSPHYRKDTAAWRAEVDVFCRTTRFLGLSILATDADTVTFHALLVSGQQDASFRERSRFAQHEGRWKYLQGTQE